MSRLGRLSVNSSWRNRLHGLWGFSPWISWSESRELSSSWPADVKVPRLVVVGLRGRYPVFFDPGNGDTIVGSPCKMSDSTSWQGGHWAGFLKRCLVRRALVATARRSNSGLEQYEINRGRLGETRYRVFSPIHSHADVRRGRSAPIMEDSRWLQMASHG